MGMLRCSRGNCDEVMCDRYSNRYGYICDKCFNDLCRWEGSIKAFMETNPTFSTDSYEEKQEMYNIIFPKRSHE